jgi:hypothetical protein
LALEWPTNTPAFHVQYATNLAAPVQWQPLPGILTTNAENIQAILPPALGSSAFFRLSTGAP